MSSNTRDLKQFAFSHDSKMCAAGKALCSPRCKDGVMDEYRTGTIPHRTKGSGGDSKFEQEAVLEARPGAKSLESLCCGKKERKEEIERKKKVR